MLAKSLQKGDTIGLIAPSKPFNQSKKFELDNFVKYMDGQGIKVKLSKNFFASDRFSVSAGTPKDRADDINSMFLDKNIKAIWCLQGGESANQTLDLIDFDIIKNNPKLFLGKSDIDVLLLAINKSTKMITIHCCDPKIGSNKEMDFDYTKEWFNKRLFQKSKVIEPSKEWICVNKGKAKGKIIGCNLTSILKLAGTKYFPNFTNSIFFIESYQSNPGKIIWQLAQLKELGVFKKVKGIVIGNNFEFDSNIFTVEEMVKEQLAEYNLPILKINEFGHYQPHAFLPIGAKVKLDATNRKLEIIDDFIE